MKQSNATVSSRSAADSKHGVRQQRKPCQQSSDSFLVRPSHSYSTNAETIVKKCQRRASAGWRCNRERARPIMCRVGRLTLLYHTIPCQTNILCTSRHSLPIMGYLTILVDNPLKDIPNRLTPRKKSADVNPRRV